MNKYNTFIKVGIYIDQIYYFRYDLITLNVAN